MCMSGLMDCRVWWCPTRSTPLGSATHSSTRSWISLRWTSPTRQHGRRPAGEGGGGGGVRGGWEGWSEGWESAGRDERGSVV